MNKNKKILILLLLLLLFLFILYFIKSSRSNSLPEDKPLENNNQTEQTNNQKNSESTPSEIIKCQNIVVAPRITTELYTYKKGNLTRADYRYSEPSTEGYISTQVLYDGDYVYLWNRLPKYDSSDKVNNPPGVKTKLSNFNFKIIPYELDEVVRFGASQLSGDRLCTIWDDVDPVFEVPSDFIFNESPDTQKKIQENIARICKTCDLTTDGNAKESCRRNLGC